ncbi:MAG TPA: aminoglycoside phosphotransferase family protein [Pseudonocardiaceae bacterium]
MLTDDELARRTAHAVTAAAGAGRALGLTVTAPVALYDVFSVVVHLAPSPVVARVHTVLPRLIEQRPEWLRAQQRHELAVAWWLAEQGHPVVPPSPLVPLEPVRHDGLAMTFWQFVEQVPDADPPMERRMEITAELHARLRGYRAELPFMVPLDEYIPDCLEQLVGRPDLLDPAGVDRARREWDVIGPLVASPGALLARFPGATVQPVHGDAPFYNIIPTPAGELCGDLEHVTLGVPEWDLVGADDDALGAYDKAAAELGLRPPDRHLLAVMSAARSLQMVACLTLIPQLPSLKEGLAPFLDHWRTTPEAVDLLR